MDDAQAQGPTGWMVRVRERRLALAALLTLFIAIGLNTFQQSFSLTDATTLDAFLSADQQATRDLILREWSRGPLLALARGALWIDFAFIAAYGSFFWLVAAELGRELRADASALDPISLAFPWADNSGPVSRLGNALRLDRLLRGLTVLLVAVDLVEDICGLVVLSDSASSLAGAMNGAHTLKLGLIAATLLVFVALVAIWLLNLGSRHNVGAAEGGQDSVVVRLIERALFRRDIADILWRSRYAIAMIVFFSAITIVMDQGRDLLVGIAQSCERSGWTELALVLATLAGVWLFAYSCFLWPRIMCRIRRPSRGRPAAPRTSHAFAKWWARLLGAMPMFILAWLSGKAARDAFFVVPLDAAQVSGTCTAGSAAVAVHTGVLLLWCGFASLLLAALFFVTRIATTRLAKRSPHTYFEVLDAIQAREEVRGGTYKIAWLIPRAPLAIVPLAFGAVFGLRLWAFNVSDVPLALAAAACAMALWNSALGHLGALALRQETPWVLIVGVVSGVLGTLGFTDNHRIPVLDSAATGLSLLSMSTASMLLGLALLVWWGGALWMKHLPDRLRNLVYTAWLLMALLAVWLTLSMTSRAALTASAAPSVAPAMAPRAELDAALVAWLKQLCGADPACKDAKPDHAGDLKANLVYAEGGGIRSAYWTALVLGELTKTDPQFLTRSFSVSGVSGGAIGAAAWRACLDKVGLSDTGVPKSAKDLADCIDELGKTDLLMPLVSAWLFEDVLGKLIPTSACGAAGCGFLSRGLWFERQLESSVAVPSSPGAAGLLTQPLNGWASAASSPVPQLPRLFLNSTAVESGERAIGSDVHIRVESFPNARDEQEELAANLKLSTGAHNAARFPFVNAIGAIHPRNGICLHPVPSAGGPTEPAKPSALRPDLACLHLADGGYFDNSGAQTTQDIVRALRRLLEPDSTASAIRPEDRAMLDWLRPRLRVQGIFIRNGVEEDAVRIKCEQIGAAGTAASAASVPSHLPYQPWTNSCQAPLTLYTDLLGPLVTAKNAGGTGASGRLAESRLLSVIADFNARSGARPGWSAAPVLSVELKQGHVLYPLGWYLSEQARTAMHGETADAVRRAAGVYPAAAASAAR